MEVTRILNNAVALRAHPDLVLLLDGTERLVRRPEDEYVQKKAVTSQFLIAWFILLPQLNVYVHPYFHNH